MNDFFIAITPVTQSFSQFARRFSRRVAAKLLKTCRIRIDYLNYSHHSTVNLTCASSVGRIVMCFFPPGRMAVVGGVKLR